MKHLSRFIRFAALSSALVATTAVYANAEDDEIIREDIASAQVMTETCPAAIGKNAKFDQNIQKAINALLGKYSNKSTTLESLQKSAEYQEVLTEVRESAKEVDAEEQKAVCEEVAA
ncbi:MAG: hypothetical protein KA331_01870 [Acinetobacter sp.]|nr:hypothetical protein [Acinetobacter sp.]